MLHRWPCIYGRKTEKIDIIVGGGKQSPEEMNMLGIQHSDISVKLNIPCSKLLWGDRAFSVAANHLWNHLPYEIMAAPSVNIFKPLLKTHLFSQ